MHCTRSDKDARLAEAQQQVRKHLLLASLDDQQFQTLMAHARLVDLDSDQTLFIQGDDAERFYIVLHGRVKLFRLTTEGREIVMNVLNQDAAVGEAAMFMAEHHYPVNASAIEHSSVLALSSQVYQRLLRDSSESCFGVLAAMACRLQNSMAEIETLTLKSASHRVIRFLLTLIEENEEQVELKLPVAKQLIAARLAMQPETFSRVMRELKSHGVLEVHGCHLKIISVPRLKELML
ncbi:Crp/Fnr family transcriptional regulator [uncultured Neptuniibacter sp.]|uniref:Crp/Fnr family transcriptional regulator n=1 Tax=uncultured Neptuniibacter sp. TaxID=502143 RepID=UPI00262D9307|nr:Crp/Fnr family transcriptional regulator [uncultured Neptuniibacter sp.]